MNSTPKSTKKLLTSSPAAYNTPCRRIGLHRLDNSITGGSQSTFGTPDSNNNKRISSVARSRTLQFSSPVQQENVSQQNQTNAMLKELNANNSSSTKTPVKTSGKNDLTITTPTYSSHHNRSSINRRQLIKRIAINDPLIDDENTKNVKRNKCCGLSKTFNKSVNETKSSSSTFTVCKSPEPMIISRNNKLPETLSPTNQNHNPEIINNDIYRNNNINELKSSIRLWTEGFKKALEILEEKFETTQTTDNYSIDRESILRKFNITLNLSDYEHL